MAVVKRFTGKPLQVDDTPENMELVREIAEKAEVSQAAVVRQLLHAPITLTQLHEEACARA